MTTITEVQEKLDKMANWVRSDFMVNRELLACELEEINEILEQIKVERKLD